MTQTPQSYYTPKEVADMLKVAPQTVYNWIRDGELKAVQFGKAKGSIRVPQHALDEFLKPYTELTAG